MKSKTMTMTMTMNNDYTGSDELNFMRQHPEHPETID